MPGQPSSGSVPGEPGSHVDRALLELMDQAGEVTQAQDRLKALLRATQTVVEPLDLPVVLERIVQAAIELVDARYGALGIIAEQGGLEAFIHVGMPPEQVAAIGHLPEGRGVLGALIDDARPIRLRHIADDPRSVGFPAGHPPMDGFLGVPVRVRDEVYGNLYLTEPRAGEFTRADEELVLTLAATAGFAIANARLYDETLLRQQWTASSAQIASALLETASPAAIPLLADELAARTTADRICILVPGERIPHDAGRRSTRLRRRPGCRHGRLRHGHSGGDVLRDGRVAGRSRGSRFRLARRACDRRRARRGSHDGGAAHARARCLGGDHRRP